jgi:hypothetical protein
VPDNRRNTLHGKVAENVNPGATVYTDEGGGYSPRRRGRTLVTLVVLEASVSTRRPVRVILGESRTGPPIKVTMEPRPQRILVDAESASTLPHDVADLSLREEAAQSDAELVARGRQFMAELERELGPVPRELRDEVRRKWPA